MKRICMIAVCAAVAVGCRPTERTVEITELRVVERDFELGLSTAERFSARPKRTKPESLFGWDLPDGWTEKPLTQFRLASFDTPGGGDCSLSRSGGSLSMNVNRWRGQFGLEAISAEAADALPKKPVFGGGEGLLVECEGTYQPMTGEPVAGMKMLGLIVRISDELSLFVKLVGKVETVDAERGRFFALAESLTMDDARNRAGPAPQAGSFDPSALQWTLPGSWEKRESTSQMRILSAGPQGVADVECWVIALAGEAGGLVGNVNRWLGEVGKPVLSESEILALPQLTVLGRSTTLIEAYGNYAGQSGSQSGAGLLGAICSVGSHSLFIKLVGPADQVRREKDSFISFCESLRS